MSLNKKFIAINQPYIFPNLTYFQMINAVETFIIFDDVQYKRRSFINRNFINQSGLKKYITFAVKKNNREAKINQMYYSNTNLEKNILNIQNCYKNYKNFKDVFQMINNTFKNFKEKNIAEINKTSLELILNYLNIKKKFIFSSKINYERNCDASKKIQSIIKSLNYKNYINLPGGIKLYDKKDFLKQKINIKFINSINNDKYNNVYHFSIIDLLMQYSKNEIRKLLNSYRLI